MARFVHGSAMECVVGSGHAVSPDGLKETEVNDETVVGLAEEIYAILSRGPFAIFAINRKHSKVNPLEIGSRTLLEGSREKVVRAFGDTGGRAVIYIDDDQQTWAIQQIAHARVTIGADVIVVSQDLPGERSLVWTFLPRQ